MNGFIYILIGIYLALLVYYMVFKKIGNHIVVGIVKMSMSTIFTGLTYYGVYYNGFDMIDALLLSAMVFAWFGDFFLRYMGKDAIKFNVGLVCFALCQTCLIAYFFISFGLTVWLALIIAITIGFTLIFWTLLKKSKAELGISRPFVKGYMCTMSILVGFAIVFIITCDTVTAARVMLGIGAILFFVSDVFLGVYSYIFKKRILTMINSLTYFGGMLLIAISTII